jgi:hypothetical protein
MTPGGTRGALAAGAQGWQACRQLSGRVRPGWIQLKTVRAISEPWSVSRDKDKRFSARVPISVIGIEVGTLCGTGRIYDVSATGLRVEECGIVPAVGESTKLTFVLSVEQPAFEVQAQVVRHTETGGFAVTFVAVEPRFRDLVAALAERVQKLPDIPAQPNRAAR